MKQSTGASENSTKAARRLHNACTGFPQGFLSEIRCYKLLQIELRMLAVEISVG